MKKILVVDDSPAVREEVAAALVPNGFSVIEAVDGIDGKTKFDASTDLALVICDVNMPRKSGIEMLNDIHRERGGQPVPVLMMTTEGSASMIKQAQEAGVRTWIVKPFRSDQLIAAVKRLTEAK